MRVREVGWVLFLAGLPFPHFFLNSWLDQWSAQTLWAHVWVVVLFGVALTTSQKVTVPNWPLALWFIWISLSTLWLWTTVQVQLGKYALGLLMPWLHCLSLIGFYHAATRTWDRAMLQRLLRWVARAGVVVMVYGALQVLNLDQFYQWSDRWMDGDPLVGTIGNQTHFGAYLALLLPVLLLQQGLRWRLAVGLNLILVGLTASASAMVCAYSALLWWSWFQSRVFFFSLVAIGVVGILTILLWRQDFVNPQGRLEAWRLLWDQHFVGDHKKQITGYGVGYMMQFSKQITEGPLHTWRHVHSEPFQVLLEQGIVGLGLVTWAVCSSVKKVFRLVKDPLVVCLGGLGITFVLNSLVNFPAHLWMLASLGLVAYCGIDVLASEGETWSELIQN